MATTRKTAAKAAPEKPEAPVNPETPEQEQGDTTFEHIEVVTAKNADDVDVKALPDNAAVTHALQVGYRLTGKPSARVEDDDAPDTVRVVWSVPVRGAGA